jgi:DNA-binding MarR family transcriptional regulator
MMQRGASTPAPCSCLALRQATRHVTQFYDEYLAPSGLRTTQFSILSKLKGLGPVTINALARELVMDRTTLGRTMLPLERDGLIRIEDGTADRRSKQLTLTQAGASRLRLATRRWTEAQEEFERAIGADRASHLRVLLGDVVACPLAAGADAASPQRTNRKAVVRT